MLYFLYACAYRDDQCHPKRISQIKNTISITPSERILQDALSDLLNSGFIELSSDDDGISTYSISTFGIDSVELTKQHRSLRAFYRKLDEEDNFSIKENLDLAREKGEDPEVMWDICRKRNDKDHNFYSEFLGDVTIVSQRDTQNGQE